MKFKTVKLINKIWKIFWLLCLRKTFSLEINYMRNILHLHSAKLTGFILIVILHLKCLICSLCLCKMLYLTHSSICWFWKLNIIIIWILKLSVREISFRIFATIFILWSSHRLEHYVRQPLYITTSSIPVLWMGGN